LYEKNLKTCSQIIICLEIKRSAIYIFKLHIKDKPPYTTVKTPAPKPSEVNITHL